MSSTEVAVCFNTSERSDRYPEMPRREEERHHSLEDQFYTYSDDDSGSINDSYFLPPTSPPDERPRSNGKKSGKLHAWREGVNEISACWSNGYQTTLQPWSESGVQDSTDMAGVSTSHQALAAQGQSSYGSVVSELSRPAAQSEPSMQSNTPLMGASPTRPSLSHITDKKLYRQLRRKQLEHIAREKAVHEVRGTLQDNKCRDTVWAALFVVQLLLVAFAAVRFGSGVVLKDNESNKFVKSLGVVQITDSVDGVDTTAFTDVDDVLEQLKQFDTTDDVPERLATSLFTIDYQNVIDLCGISGFYACVLSILTVGFMLIIAKSLIQTALVFSIILSLAWGWISLSVPGSHLAIPIMGFVALFLTLGYTIVVWDRIPFAATNLHTALCAMRCTADITLVGLGMLMLAFAWCVMWSTAFIGIVDTINTRDCEGIDDDDTYCTTQATHSHILLYVVLVISFFWTILVIKNIVQVTVASAVGTWWFHPEEISPCCTSAVTSPLVRSFTTSLGPICFGSLVLIPCQFVTALANLCCVPIVNYVACKKSQPGSKRKGFCGFVDSIVHFSQCCNRWSYTYIGMYRYGFLDGGDTAMKLFKTREWMEVVSDNLIPNVLFIGSIVIGGSTGTFGVLAEEVDGYTFSSFHKPVISAFIIGSVLGFVLSNILLQGVIGSAVNTILVCFAAGPFEFHQNHPRLSDELRDSWSQQVWEDSPV